MTDTKACDIHAGEQGRNNPVFNSYHVAISQPATQNGVKGTKVLELDACAKDVKELFFDRAVGLGIDISKMWQFQAWTSETQNGQSKRKFIKEPLAGA